VDRIIAGYHPVISKDEKYLDNMNLVQLIIKLNHGDLDIQCSDIHVHIADNIAE